MIKVRLDKAAEDADDDGRDDVSFNIGFSVLSSIHSIRPTHEAKIAK